MKRTFFTAWIALILCFCMVFSFSGCVTRQEAIDNAVNEAIGPLNAQIAQLNKDIAEKDESIAQLNKDITEKNEKIASLENEKSALSAEISKLKAELSALEATNTALTEKIAALELKITALEAEIGILETEIADLGGTVSFTINDTLPDGNGKKAKIILIGGQSNAAGTTYDAYLKQNVSAEKYTEYENGYDNVYINYFTSGSNESRAFVKCAARQGEAGVCFGPELGIADKLHELYPDETFFIVKWAWGGSNLYDQWRAPSSEGKTGAYYQAFVSYVKTSVEYLVSKNYDVEIEGMCWMQGESDACWTESALNYGQNLTDLIGDIRKRFATYAAEDGIAFVDAYIAAPPAPWTYYEIVNQAKQNVADSSPMNVAIDTISEGLIVSREPVGGPDLAHYDSLSELKLGHLFAEELAKFFE